MPTDEEIHGVKIPWLKSDPNDPAERQRPSMKPCKPGYAHVWHLDEPEPDMKRCAICGHTELMTYCHEGTEHEWVAEGDGGYHCANCDETRWDDEEHDRWARGDP
jgi:hypothetical protein